MPIQEETMRRVGSFVALVVISFFLGCQPTGSPANTPGLVIVKGSLNTTANNGPGQVINIDGAGGAALPFGKIKRYTITLQTAGLSTAPAGVDKIAVFVGVLAGTTATAVGVILQDPATASPFLHSGMTVLPYAGTNSYIKVFRGADGLGPVEIQFNAYVEVEP
jgi:hypothetical protein